MTDRRFNEVEVAAIFERASKAPRRGQRQLGSGEGMTLAQLQEIGREVGIPPERLVEAAAAIELAGRSTSRRFLGLPIGVGLSIELGRKLSDEEWERFVADLRETFDAPGSMKQEGSSRHWSNGNLQAFLEPSATGHRIRLRTVKGDARGLMIGGLGLLGFASSAMVIAALRGLVIGDVGFLLSLATLGTMGAGMFGVAGLRLPGWARLRSRQMEEVAARAAALASLPPAREPRDAD